MGDVHDTPFVRGSRVELDAWKSFSVRADVSVDGTGREIPSARYMRR